MSLQANSLSKSYGPKVVVNDVSINVKQGEIVGLLGPNGAGKTTTFYSIVGLIKPDEGFSNPAIRFNNLVFPEPLGPETRLKKPELKLRFKSLKTSSF